MLLHVLSDLKKIDGTKTHKLRHEDCVGSTYRIPSQVSYPNGPITGVYGLSQRDLQIMR